MKRNIIRMKRFLSVLLAASVIVLSVPYSVFADDTVPAESYVEEVNQITESGSSENTEDNVLSTESVSEEFITEESATDESGTDEPSQDEPSQDEPSQVESSQDEPVEGVNTYPNNNYAKEGYGKVNENRDPSATLIEGLDNDLKLILSGVNQYIATNDAARSIIIDTVNQFLNSEETIKYMNSTAFIDAEKYSIIYEGYDSNYCWGGTASNMLWLSGWGTKLGYGNEDKIMSDLHDKFNDDAEEPRDAITWLFDNYINNVEVETKKESTQGGKATGICISEAFYTYNNVAGALNNLASLADVDSQATAIQCHWIDKAGDVKSGSHWLTAVGVVLNEATTNLVDYFKAIILADSDDTPGMSENAPASETESYNQRSDTINMYKICTLETINVNGVDYWYIPGYIDIDGKGALITGIESLEYYSEDLKKEIIEPYGTKDAANSLELIYGGIMYTYGGSVYEPQYSFCGENANVRMGYVNASAVSVKNVKVPVRVTICDNNKAELDSKVYYMPVDEIADNSRGYFDINIGDLTNKLSAGDYFVRVMFNPPDVEDRLVEAYYLNNDLVSCWIKITEASGGADVNNAEMPTEENNNNISWINQDSVNALTDEELAVIDKELENEGISKDAIKAIDQMFSQNQITYFAPETKIDTTNVSDCKIFMAGNPGEFISAEIDGVKLELSEIKIMRNSANSYRLIIDGNTLKGLKKGTHKILIYSVRGALPIEIEITII